MLTDYSPTDVTWKNCCTAQILKVLLFCCSVTLYSWAVFLRVSCQLQTIKVIADIQTKGISSHHNCHNIFQKWFGVSSCSSDGVLSLFKFS